MMSLPDVRPTLNILPKPSNANVVFATHFDSKCDMSETTYVYPCFTIKIENNKNWRATRRLIYLLVADPVLVKGVNTADLL